MATTNSNKGKSASTSKSASKGARSSQVGVVLGDLTEAVDAFHSELESTMRMDFKRSQVIRRLIADGLAHNGK